MDISQPYSNLVFESILDNFALVNHSRKSRQRKRTAMKMAIVYEYVFSCFDVSIPLAPSLRDIRDDLQVGTTSLTSRYVSLLEQTGLIISSPARVSRGIFPIEFIWRPYNPRKLRNRVFRAGKYVIYNPLSKEFRVSILRKNGEFDAEVNEKFILFRSP